MKRTSRRLSRNPRWGRRGAGVLPIACSTGRVLLTLRSGHVMEPHTWGIPGGKVDDEDEDEQEAALREVREELGYRGPVTLVRSFRYEESGFVYQNYLGLVRRQFKPRLNWESDDASWFDPQRLPSPLHFGVRELFARELPRIVEACTLPR